MQIINFNKPYLSGNEFEYMRQTVETGRTAGNQIYTKKCHNYFQEKFGFSFNLLTTSCTDALEMSALLLSINPNDEIIMPSFTFSSTANAFMLRGAKIVFADSSETNPNIDHTKIEALITDKTKAIVIVHYAGFSCAIDEIIAIAKKNNLFLIEDAAQAIDSYYKGKPLGSFGDFSTFSFHETKNIICGEGGLLVVNNKNYIKKAEIIWEKGTNRVAFFRGEIDKYRWVDIGSSFLMSDILAAYLYAQLENLEKIQQKRVEIWNYYYENLQTLNFEHVLLPDIPPHSTINGHLFYLICNNIKQRSDLIHFLKKNNIHAIFHYQSLHNSPMFKNLHDERSLTNCDMFADCLVRLPLYYELTKHEQNFIVEKIIQFFSL